ncbi:4-hydroxy-tetrahydrodipicolinate synthase [soil metagenome]
MGMGSFAGPRDWGRLLTAMLTPFNPDGSVNKKEVARVAAYLVDEQKNDGIVVNGTTGESPTLTESEKLEILEIVLDTIGDRAAVVFGAGSYNTAESIHMTREGEKRGAHGIMAVNPYYNKPGQAGMYAHFKAIAEATGLPFMIYNIIPRAAINLDTPTLLKLAEIPNVVAVKEASGSISQISDVCGAAPEGFRVYSGDDAMTLPALAVGAHGLVSVAAHVIGADIKDLIQSFEEDPAKARALHHKCAPVIKAVFSAPSPVPIKYALSKRGFDTQAVRLPLVELNDEEKAVVDRAIH